jgi:hypothetical protein
MIDTRQVGDSVRRERWRCRTRIMLDVIGN